MPRLPSRPEAPWHLHRAPGRKEGLGCSMVGLSGGMTSAEVAPPAAVPGVCWMDQDRPILASRKGAERAPPVSDCALLPPLLRKSQVLVRHRCSAWTWGILSSLGQSMAEWPRRKALWALPSLDSQPGHCRSFSRRISSSAGF